MSVDPIAIKAERLKDPQRLNLYTYAANNPVIYFDPTGEDVEVGNRAVGGTLGVGGHAFIIVIPTGANVQKYQNRIDPNTGTITLSGFPSPVTDPRTGDTTDMLTKSENDPRDVNQAEQTLNVPAPQGTSMEQFEADVIEAFDSYQNNVPYEALPDSGTGEGNSNSLASGILDAAGTEQNDKPDTDDLDRYNPGWEDPVRLPDATVNNNP